MSINVDELLSELDKSMSEVALQQQQQQQQRTANDRSFAPRMHSMTSRSSSPSGEDSPTDLRFTASVRQRTSSNTQSSAKFDPHFQPPPFPNQGFDPSRAMPQPHWTHQMPQPQFERYQHGQQQQQPSPLSPSLPFNDYNGSVFSKRSQEEEEVLMLREQLEIAKMELEHQEYLNQLLLFQNHQQSASGASNSNASISNSAVTTTSSTTPSALSRHPTGWGGRSSKRFSNPISDIIIDEACLMTSSTAPMPDKDNNHVPVNTVFAAINLIQEAAQASTNKGLGANQAIHAIMHVINAQDPIIVRRGMQVLDIAYRFAGPIFWLNLSLNLDFFQHFFETRQHTTPEELDNVEFLCGLFAGWYAMDAPDEKVLKSLNNMKDPSGKVKEFFEGLVRAGYSFPEGSLKLISAERIAAIKGWSLMRRGFTFTSVKR
ncbi:hypothetical protein HDU81_004428 [Chytriomyces hyalinus]|nr:hypothetical protein HDU81_004428 [Chytriomyces hyalinus]